MAYVIDSNLKVVTWEALGASENGTALPVNPAGLAVSAVQLTGTFGGTVYIEGSLDGTTFFSLRDTRGTLMEYTAAALAELSSGVRYIRPRTGTGVSDVDVKLTVGT